ncbi:hypothetical protein ACIRON_02775 [Nocardioides sp. NPDC101246]|uniref:hypothetical protein n=1 Tax=Nocardioides sp. NPDC101246 TaxID=3364336 RepID=UPI0038182B5C
MSDLPVKPDESARAAGCEEALTTVLEFMTVGLLSIVLFAVWPAAALLPWAGLAGFLAWNRGGWGRS